MKIIVVLGLIAATFGAAFARELPEFIHVCKRDTPDMSQCMKNSVDYFKPYLKTGLPEYKIPSLEPLKLNEVASAAGNIKLILRNVTVHGASNFTIVRLKAKLATLKLTTHLSIPTLSIQSNYNVDGKVILLRIRGDGPMEGTFHDCRAVVKMQMEKTKGDDDKVHLKLSELTTKISVGSGVLKLQNLFGGDPTLGEAVNAAINSNIVSFVNEIRPALEDGISSTFIEIANSMLSQFTYDDLFPVS